MSQLYNMMKEDALIHRNKLTQDQRPCECNVVKCIWYNGDFLDYNCDDSAPVSFICSCPMYCKFNNLEHKPFDESKFIK